jgi:hypothetical protein
MPAFLTLSDIPCRSTLEEQHLPKKDVSLPWFLLHSLSLDAIDINDEVLNLI